LDEIGAETAEAKASHLLKGLQFTPEIQNKKCKDFSGGWRMRIGKLENSMRFQVCRH
jgi:ATP-binding cassette subfamily F protein 2